MRLEGIHHVTAITGQAQANVDFYAGTLGLRFVKRTVNYDQPDVYHLYFGDEAGTPGSIMTFFEFPGMTAGRHGAGMIHTLTWRVPSLDALDFWEQRLAGAGIRSERGEGSSLHFADPEGIGIEFAVVEVDDSPLLASARGIPPEHALQGFHGARAYAADPERSRPLLDALGFEDGTRVNGGERHAVYEYEPAPDEPGIQGSGTVHHIAWASRDEDHERWRETAIAAGAHPTPVIDRTYFRSIYFREPSGVLFELATLSPGFTVDEPADRLGRALVLPPHLEHRRGQLERQLTPIAVPH